MALPSGTVGFPYLTQLAAAGAGTGTLTWSVVSGTLPAGLALGVGTGIITGTPTAACACAVTIRAVRGTAVAERSFTLQISPDPVPGFYTGTWTYLSGVSAGVVRTASANLRQWVNGVSPYLLSFSFVDMRGSGCGVDVNAGQLALDLTDCMVDALGHQYFATGGTISLTELTISLRTNGFVPSFAEIRMTRAP